MNIAYIINSYPMTSTTFIRREIWALERQGVQTCELHYALGTANSLKRAIRSSANEHVTSSTVNSPLLCAVVRMLLARPFRFMQALALAYRMSRRAKRPLVVHLAYFAEACRIEPWLRKAKIQHVHAHFGTNPAEVAMLVRLLAATVELYRPRRKTFDRRIFIGTTEKIQRY